MTAEHIRYKYCIVPRCTNTTITTPNKLFISVPKGKKIRKQWCNAMKRDYKRNKVLSSTCNRFCCEDHFELESDMENYIKWKMMGGNVRLRKGVLPHIFKCQQSGSESIKPERGAAAKRRRVEILQHTESSNLTHTSTSVKRVDCSSGSDATEDNPLEFSDDGPTLVPDNDHVRHKKIQVRRKDFSRSKQVQTDNTINKSNVSCSPIRRAVSHVSTSPIKCKQTHSLENLESSCSSENSTDWECSSSDTNFEPDDEYKACMLKGTLMSIGRAPKLYLGIPKESYFCLQILSDKVPVPHTHILITLKKIRLNEPYTILAMQFGRSSVNIGQIFRRTVPLLSKYFQELIIWPPPNKVAEHLPIAFRSRYSKVQSIIDCFEVRIQKPSNPLHQSLTWSEYKSCNTVKYMISCTPDGVVNFVSCGFGGRTSDTAIFENCGYVSNLSPGIEVMADRGFKNVSHILNQYDCSLVRPPSVSANTLSSREEVIESKRIASLRIHVERVIGRLREFNMTLPHACVDLRHLAIFDEVVIIVCGLINLQNKLIKF